MNFILPSFYNSYNHNQELIQKYLLFKNFSGIYGNFPFSIFNGSYNNSASEELALAEDIVKSVSGYGSLSSCTIIDFGNIDLKEEDYYDSFNKVILETYANSRNAYFSIASRKFAQYLVDNYPNIQLIIHQNYTNLCSEEEVKLIIDMFPNNIKYLIITPNNYCTNINIPKIYWIPYTICYCCPQYKKCIQIDNNLTLEYSEGSQFAACNNKQFLTLEYLQAMVEDAKNHTDTILFDNIIKEHEEEIYNTLNLLLGGSHATI